ncbi:4Fe-4S dicluster domain-containing protein [Desulfosediminicola ganghwensis]|uniref:4Fe-4S dicluster domain-containing protein n=1 Tax=Desulfosediminicola ganghwensis TaxID=2569540 RepID=UPI0010AD2874|nr:4Fe-4S dicluster domain-containing protein [Desulfosediminicola ganghwensis]
MSSIDMSTTAQMGRRQFLKLMHTGLVVVCTLPLPGLSTAAEGGAPPTPPNLLDTPNAPTISASGKGSAPIPPGAGSLKAFRRSCTACQLCVSQCPSGVLRPAFLENGIAGFMQPVLKYGIHHFCDYQCRKCIEICPTKALGTMSLAEKKVTRIGIAKLVIDECIVKKDDKACGACAEHCPTGALKMVPYKPGITKPEIVHKEACIGCGGCESICPVRKIAIYIDRMDIHEKAEKPKVFKQEKIGVEDFGF